MLNIATLPALRDNYIWALHDHASVAVVDPGEAAPVLDFLERTGRCLSAILCTHRHADHVGGIARLREVYNVPVYGHSHPQNPHVTHDLGEGDRLELSAPPLAFDIWETPGHLADHIVFVAPGKVFCGDILFGAGCGRNFEGTLEALRHSLSRLAALPDDTLVYCAHEYTEYLLPFSLQCEPGNPDIRRRMDETQRLRRCGQGTVPLTLGEERATNPFLRCTSPELVHTLQQRGLRDTDEASVFAALYAWHADF